VIGFLALGSLAAAAVDVARPREPWVYRCELDGRARVLGVALQTDLWLAYDTESCSLARATRGDPQRVAKDWLDDGGGGVWWLARDGHATALAAQYKGFDVRDGHATLHYELASDGVRVEVDETPEFVRAGELGDDPAAVAPWLTSSKFALRRTFQARGVPAGAQLSLTLACELRHAAGDFLAQNVRDLDETPLANGATRLTARLALEGDAASNEILLFFDPATVFEAKR
jgi:hypothetical protein